MASKRAREQDFESTKPTKIRRDDFEDQLDILVNMMSKPDPRTEGGASNPNFLSVRDDRYVAMSNQPKLKEKGIYIL